MYQIDHTKTEMENFLGLINQGMVPPFQASDITRDSMGAVTPTIANGNNNTTCWLRAVNPVVANDRVRLYYNRIDVNENRPSAGNQVLIRNGDTHASIHAKIAEQFRFVPGEITFVDPLFIPAGGKTSEYTVRSKSGSYLYTGGGLVITARNIDAPDGPYPVQSLLGLPPSMRFSAPFYATKPFTFAEFGDADLGVQEAVAKYLDSLVLEEELKGFNSTDVEALYGGGWGNGQFITQVEPKPANGYLLNRFYVRFLSDPIFGTGRNSDTITLNDIPAAIMDEPTLSGFVSAFRAHFKIPNDALRDVTGNITSTESRTLRFFPARHPVNGSVGVANGLFNTTGGSTFNLVLNRET